MSVTQLATFACRTGDLLPDAVVGPTAREGMRAHSRLQAHRQEEAGHPEQLKAELSINCLWTGSGRTIRLGGRVDLVDTRTHQLSEIKSTYVPGEQVPQPKQSLQWAQLYLYGFVYLQQLQALSPDVVDAGPELPEPVQKTNTEPVTRLDLELVHINLRDNSQHSQVRKVSAKELTAYGETALETYAQWLDKVEIWQADMQASASTLQFPFGQFRQGQRDMAVAVYRSCRDASPLMCEAATGIGKTLSSLYPAVKSMGEGELRQIVFMTAKVAGKRSAVQAVEHLTHAGLCVTMIQIGAKASSCFCQTGDCERDASGRCPMTLGFFDRLPDARHELLSLGVISDTQLKDTAWQHQLCPFALVQQLLPWVHIIVADYNYVFDPLVRLPYFSASTQRTVLLVDEAHNLLDRARTMYSAQLDREACRQAADECRTAHPLVARALDKLGRQLLAADRQKNGEDGVVLQSRSEAKDPSNPAQSLLIKTDPPAALARCVSDAVQQINVVISEGQVPSDQLRTVWQALGRYSVINDLFTDRHRFVVETLKPTRHKQVVVSLFCIDPSQALARSYRAFKSLIAFSATLRPTQFYQDSLGIENTAGSLQLPSPFDAQKCFRSVVDWVDTRYRYRHESVRSLVELIRHVTQEKAGNYLVFFPSYAYLELTYNTYKTLYPSCNLWSQSRAQSVDEQQTRVNELDHSDHSVGFAIQGGVFGEGIDYAGNKLIGTLIIGTGLPAMNWKSDLVSDFYREQGRNGYDFAYKYPGFTRVLQSAGRVIRSEHDKGVIILIDPRFKHNNYRHLFPIDWKVQYSASQQELLVELHKFWS